MVVRLYGVLDEKGTKVNTISADESLIATDWYPGYGAALIDEGEVPADPPKPPPVTKPTTWGVLPFQLETPMSNGDTIDFETGKVTKAPPVIVVEPEPVIEPVAEIP